MQVSTRWQTVLLMVIGLLLSGSRLSAQVIVQGTVFDGSMINGLQEVDVTSGSGAHAITDSTGRYHIRLSEKDSLYFSYLGKRTPWFPVKDMQNPDAFDVSMYGVESVSITPLTIQANSYHLDSLQNREEYRELFDYEGGNYVTGGKTRGRGLGVGLDFDMLLTGRNIARSRESTQRYMIEDERQRYIDHRFTKALVGRLTGLLPPALDTFMKMYRPSYEQLQAFENQVALDQYITEAGRSFPEMWAQIEAYKRRHFVDTTLHEASDAVEDSVGR
jgi:hypothetical protein